MIKKRSLTAITVLAVLLLSLQACVVRRFSVGTLQTDYETVELGDAESARVDINMAFGEIEIDGGASDLMEAEFVYNVDELEPRVDYSVSGSTGRLTVEHRDNEGVPIGDYDDVRSEWKLSFNDDVPIDLRMSMGATTADIDLRGVSITSLNVDVGAGEGDLWLGDGPLRSLDINMGVGSFTIDMTAGWETNLNAEISGGVGKLTMYLPSDVGVRVDVEMGVTTIGTKGLNKDGNTYTNDAYGESDVTLRIDLKGGVGDIQLEIRD